MLLDELTRELATKEHGDLLTTQLLLQAGADKDRADDTGCTPLLMACIRGKLEACVHDDDDLRLGGPIRFPGTLIVVSCHQCHLSVCLPIYVSIYLSIYLLNR